MVRIPLLQLDNQIINLFDVISYCSKRPAKEVIFMRNFKELVTSSYRELKDVRCITLSAIFGALSIILGALTIMVGEFLKIGFTFLPNNFIYYLFGPVIGAIYGAAMDILTFIVNPKGTFFFGFTLSAILTGVIYGSILYKRSLSLKRIIIANVIHMLLVNIVLNTYWLTILMGDGFFALLPIRALKAIIMLPIESLLLYTLIKGVEASGVLRLIYKHRARG
jgi:ECF transporter S component (folate family)